MTRLVRLAAALVAGIGALSQPGPVVAAPAPGSQTAPVPAVSVVEATRREIVESAVATGTLVARDEILVAAEVDGYRITEVLVEEGMWVERGHVLARLSRDLIDRQIAQQDALVAKATAAIPQSRNNIEQAEAAETEARLSFERAKLLMQSGNATAAIMETRTAALRQAESRSGFARNGLVIAEADLAQSRAVREELRLRLSRTDIRAPEAGIVNRRAARVGMTASTSGEPLFRLIARGEIELEAEITETKIASLKPGNAVIVALGGGDRVAGSIRAVYPEIDRTTRLGKLRIRLEPDPRLRIGAFVRASVEVARTVGVTVPQEAVLYESDRRSTVMVVLDGIVHARDVRTGLVDDAGVEVKTGLAEGELVVARAGSFLREGDRVRALIGGRPASRSDTTSSLGADAKAP